MSLANAPSGRSEPAAVWTGTQMIVWGGYNAAGYPSTGAIYEPVSDTWRATATTGSPAGRGSHTAVWTGSEMIVWGGNSGVARQDGGRYDPATDRWMPTSTSANVPSPRYLHTAI